MNTKCLMKLSGMETRPGEDTIKHLYEIHFPQHTIIKEAIYDLDAKIPKSELDDKLKKILTTEKVRRALKGFDNKKSPGPDNFKPIMFKYFTKPIYKHITDVYKACVILQFTPSLWRDTRVIFIPKPGKESYNKAKSCRPISLSNYLLKGLERIFGWHMNEQLEQYPLHPQQHGFCSNKSTESAISNTINYIESKILNSKKTCHSRIARYSSSF